MSVQVHFIGCGDAFGSGGRFQTCFLIEDSRGRIAIDFGASSLIALKRQGIDPASIDMVIVSHLHGDHFAGLPFLLLDLHLRAQSTRPLTLAGPPGFAKGLKNLCNVMYPDVWEIEWQFPFNVIEIVPGIPAELLGRSISTRQVAHSSRIAPSTAIRITCDGKTIGYSGDTGWTDELLKIAIGTELFICECNFYTRNLSETHLNYETIIENLSQIQTKRLILTHLGEEALNHLDNMNIETAEEGKVISI